MYSASMAQTMLLVQPTILIKDNHLMALSGSIMTCT